MQRLKEIVDLNNAVSVCEDALHLIPEDHTDRIPLLEFVSELYTRRFEDSERFDDIKKAVSASQDAIRHFADDHTSKPTALARLGSLYTRRFEWSGDILDIYRAISVHEEAVGLTPDDHRDKPSRLNEAGCSFMRHFESLGGPLYLCKAVSAFEGAVRLTPLGHPEMPARLNNLGVSLTRRCEHFVNPADVDKAIWTHEEAVRFTPEDHPDKASRLTHLAHSFACRYEHLGLLADLDNTISNYEAAICLTPYTHAYKPVYLSNLGKFYSCRYERIREIVDIEKAILAQGGATYLTPDGDPDKFPRFLVLVGLLHRYKQTGSASLRTQIPFFSDHTLGLRGDKWRNELYRDRVAIDHLLKDILANNHILCHSISLPPADSQFSGRQRIDLRLLGTWMRVELVVPKQFIAARWRNLFSWKHIQERIIPVVAHVAHLGVETSTPISICSPLEGGFTLPMLLHSHLANQDQDFDYVLKISLRRSRQSWLLQLAIVDLGDNRDRSAMRLRINVLG